VSVGIRWVINGALIGLLCSIGIAQQTPSSGPMRLDAIIQSMQQAQAGVRPQASYQIIREYRLFGQKDSQANSEVVAEINFRPPASRAYTIQKSLGSNRGPQVVRRILEHEAELTSRENKGSSAISSDNYTFNYIGEATVDGQSCYVLGLKPKRAASDLIAGQAWVDQHSFLVRLVDGEVEKTPSWWLKRVHVKLAFADLEGMWMQTGMEAVADVRIVGAHTLTSRILDYRREAQVAASPIAAGTITIRK
jgi:Outer membrane lipoprotein-sorting protein